MLEFIRTPTSVETNVARDCEEIKALRLRVGELVDEKKTLQEKVQALETDLAVFRRPTSEQIVCRPYGT